MAFPYRYSLKICPSQGMTLLPSLKSFIFSSFLNPRIYVSSPLKTLKSSSFQGVYSHRFVDFYIKDLQSRWRRPDSAVLDHPLPFSHWSSAISQGEGLLHGWQFSAPCYLIFLTSLCLSNPALTQQAVASLLPNSSALYETERKCCRLLLALRFEIKLNAMRSEGRLQCKWDSRLAVPPIILYMFDPVLGHAGRADNLPRSSNPNFFSIIPLIYP